MVLLDRNMLMANTNFQMIINILLEIYKICNMINEIINGLAAILGPIATLPKEKRV